MPAQYLGEVNSCMRPSKCKVFVPSIDIVFNNVFPKVLLNLLDKWNWVCRVSILSSLFEEENTLLLKIGYQIWSLSEFLMEFYSLQ